MNKTGEIPSYRFERGDYEVTDMSAVLDLDRYIGEFRDSAKFMKCCRECGNYNKRWTCPPFFHDVDSELSNYDTIRLFLTKITPRESDPPSARMMEFFQAERGRIESSLLLLEKEFGGKSLAFAGNCRYCPEGTCARMNGEPCLHPDKARPSLEAYGFDVVKTTNDIFGVEILWGKDGSPPPYLTFVSGLLYKS